MSVLLIVLCKTQLQYDYLGLLILRRFSCFQEIALLFGFNGGHGESLCVIVWTKVHAEFMHLLHLVLVYQLLFYLLSYDLHFQLVHLLHQVVKEMTIKVRQCLHLVLSHHQLSVLA